MFKKSFEQWCIKNNRMDVLLRWDYELNNCKPSEVSYSTRNKYYFKCPTHIEHKSKLQSLNSFVNRKNGNITCDECNSIAQYILDNFPNKKLEEVWDYDKNEDLNPWKIKQKANIEIWIFCQEVDYHGSYKIYCPRFTEGVRCGYCSGMKVHKLDSIGQDIINNYGEDFLWRIWSDKNNKTPFDYSIGSNKICWWNCPDDKHEPFQRDCYKSKAYNYRCPECVKERDESMIEEKTRLYLEELGYEVFTEFKCSIKVKNPKTNHYLPFDNEIILENGKHLIIEVHGVQHYDSHFYKTMNKCTKEEAEMILNQRKALDKYKKEQCIQFGYEYLELPYWSFKNEKQFKKLIDNKISDIVDK